MARDTTEWAKQEILNFVSQNLLDNLCSVVVIQALNEVQYDGNTNILKLKFHGNFPEANSLTFVKRVEICIPRSQFQGLFGQIEAIQEVYTIIEINCDKKCTFKPKPSAQTLSEDEYEIKQGKRGGESISLDYDRIVKDKLNKKPVKTRRPSKGFWQ